MEEVVPRLGAWVELDGECGTVRVRKREAGRLSDDTGEDLVEVVSAPAIERNLISREFEKQAQVLRTRKRVSSSLPRRPVQSSHVDGSYARCRCLRQAWIDSMRPGAG